jgi:hypothetical protein
MMKTRLLTGIAMLTLAISSCDEDTATMGYSLTGEADRFTILTDTFAVSTRSLIADSVLARSSTSFLGCIRDPETGSYITCDYTTQFHLLEKEASTLFPDESTISGRDVNDKAIADSCFLKIVINSYQGDSLAAMKLQVTELEQPIKENRSYYSNFNPEEEGYLRADGIRKDKMYSISNLLLSDSLRNVRRNSSYFEDIIIPLNQPYTDRQGKTYNNYGTYILRTYYEHPEYFMNSINFTNNVCHGFYLKSLDGNGVMSEIYNTQLQVYIHKTDESAGSTLIGLTAFKSTEEVLQTTRISNDKATIQKLVADNSCTYLKTPAGIFTEVELPVEDIKMGRNRDGEHLNDTITSARIVFQRMRERNSDSDYELVEPSNLLMVQRDSLYSFFENRQLPNNMTSFLATYSSKDNTYTFNNISSLVNDMWNKHGKTDNWNKCVLIPVTITTVGSTAYSTSATVAGVNNAMDITSIRLVGGSENKHTPVSISVIYNKKQ